MAPEGSPSQNPSRDPAGCGPLAFGTLVAAAAAAFFLRGLVGTPALVICSLLAGGSLAAAAAMLLGTLRGVKDRDTRRGSFELAGALVFLTAAAAMLLPLAPASVLPAIPFGTAVLEARDERLRQAVGAGDTDQVRRLASVGLAESAPRHPSGTPLIGLVDDPELLQVLLDAGLDPDIPDAYGRTPLMNSRDPERTRVLLAGGADPEAPDDLGRTALMYAASGPIERVEALLEVGASVEARDDLGRYVGDHYGDGHAALPLLQSRARGRLVMSGPGAQDPRTWGRRDWLVVAGGPGEAPGPSVEATSPHPASTLEGPDTPLTFGQTATLTASLVNPGPEPKLLMVEARLNNSAYFVGASHGGRITLPDTAPLDQTIRWPTLSLPEGAVGQIELEIVARRGLDAGDLSVDVEARDLRTNSEPEILSFYSELTHQGETSAGGSVLLGWLFLLLPLATLVAWAAASQRFEPGDPRRRWARRAVAFVFATLAGWIAFAGAAAQLRGYEATTCTILDRRVDLETRAGSSGSRNVSRIYVRPRVATRYRTQQGQEVVSTGFGADSGDLDRLGLGENVPCLYKPRRPAEFTFAEGSKLSSWLTPVLLPLAVAVGLGTWLVRDLLGPGSRNGSPSNGESHGRAGDGRRRGVRRRVSR